MAANPNDKDLRNRGGGLLARLMDPLARALGQVKEGAGTTPARKPEAPMSATPAPAQPAVAEAVTTAEAAEPPKASARPASPSPEIEAMWRDEAARARAAGRPSTSRIFRADLTGRDSS